ncbi:hypothetical protein SAMN05444277_102205 [Parafilimonas terrae]|uniref:Uncharacterized protein n=1 Tax=Parafilimonas terrae TaxID=1465490 RepID=A0A1I5TP99_9BACT|nr:hypothetical protein SAMN05444277_102205 [Parafilimonas terrae]
MIKYSAELFLMQQYGLLHQHILNTYRWDNFEPRFEIATKKLLASCSFTARYKFVQSIYLMLVTLFSFGTSIFIITQASM